MVILVNPSAGEGRAARIWQRIEPSIRRQFPSASINVLGRPEEIGPIIQTALNENRREFVAAGGDGTVQRVLQALVESADSNELRDLRLGAVGIGSSNDFHKPVVERIDGVPCKLDFVNARTRDIGVLEYDDGGSRRTVFFLSNAGIGITAEANAFFNSPDTLLSWLKRLSTSLSIPYALIRTLIAFRSMSIRMVDAIGVQHLWIANLAATKSPHCGGRLCYDSPMDLTNGVLNLHICEKASVPLLLFTIGRMIFGRFRGLPWTRSWSGTHIQISAEEAFAIEFDGEVVFSRYAAFSILPHSIRVCR